MKFKKLIIFFIIILSICILPSCAETPDEPVTDNPPIEEDPPNEDPPEKEEIIQIGMPIHKVISLLGHGTQSDLISNIYYWDTDDDKLLYVWFDGFMNVKKIERRNDLKLEAGMTYSNVCDLLDSKGQKESYAPNVYSFGLASDNKYLHVLFEQTDTDNLVVTSYAYRPNITLGMSYEEISTHFNCTPERISIERQIYYCNNDENEACILEFEETDDALTLSSFEYTENIFIFSIVGKSYNEICEALGTSGELQEHEYATGTIYRWDSDFDADLFIIFNDEMIAERFSYENDLEIKVDMTLDLAKFVLGNYKYGSNYSTWDKTPEQIAKINFNLVFETKTDFDIQFIVNVGTKKILSIMKSVPRLNINNKMHLFDVFDVLGGEGEYARGLYLWHFDNLDFIAAFDSGTGQMVTARFKECEGHEEKTE